MASENVQTKASGTVPTTAPETVQTKPPETVQTKAPETVKTWVQTFTDGNFDQTVSNGVVLVDFWAEWCGPCRRLAPTVEQLAAFYDGKVVVGKLNVDENPEIAMRYSVMSIPTLLIFSGGEVRKRLVGAKGKGQLLQELDEFLPTSR